MNDALDGCETWSRPCQRDRNRRQLTGGRVVGAGLFRLDRYLDRGNEADFQRLRFDDDAFDMPFEIGFTAPLSHADFAPWASGTSLLHQPHLGRMALPNG
jgi:hypothetical protein